MVRRRSCLIRVRLLPVTCLSCPVNPAKVRCESSVLRHLKRACLLLFTRGWLVKTHFAATGRDERYCQNKAGTYGYGTCVVRMKKGHPAGQPLKSAIYDSPLPILIGIFFNYYHDSEPEFTLVVSDSLPCVPVPVPDSP